MGDTAKACCRFLGQFNADTVGLPTLFRREVCCINTSLKGRGRCLIDLKTIPLCAISPCLLAVLLVLRHSSEKPCTEE